MWIYLGVLLLVLLPLLAGAATLKQRLAVADRSMRDRICEGGTIRGAHRAVQQIADAHIDIVTYLLTVGLAFLYPVGVLKLQQTLTGSEPNSVIPLMFAAAVLIWSASRLHQSLHRYRYCGRWL